MGIILRQKEDLIKVVRRHTMFLMPIFFSWPLTIIAVLVGHYFFKLDIYGYWILVLIGSVVLTVGIISRGYFLWRRNALIITNQRVVDNNQRGFFSKIVTELLYKDIAEISYEKNGMSASLYDFGNLKIITMADNEIIIPNIASPDETVELINKIRQNEPIMEEDV